jgi:hypothetical protein
MVFDNVYLLLTKLKVIKSSFALVAQAGWH